MAIDLFFACSKKGLIKVWRDERKEKIDHRRLAAFLMRKSGLKYREIGKLLGVSSSRARQISEVGERIDARRDHLAVNENAEALYALPYPTLYGLARTLEAITGVKSNGKPSP